MLIMAIMASNALGQPAFVWAEKMGGNSSSSAPSDAGRSIALDRNRNVYTTGNFWGSGDFDPGSGNYYLNSAGVSDVFISKLDSAGNFIWARRFGGTNYDNGNDIAVDDSGYIYVVGSFQSTVDFDPGPGVYALTPSGYRDVFVCKLDADGNFEWARQFGGQLAVNDQVDGTGVAVDGSGHVYTTGSILYGKADFDPGSGVFNLASAGDFDVFLCKLNRQGNFEWARRMGGTKRDSGNSVAADENGNTYITGYFMATADFDPGPDIRNLVTSPFNKDIFICRFDSSGRLCWANQIGVQSGDDVGEDITTDKSGYVYITGNYYYGGTDFDPDTASAYLLSAYSSSDVFICKWDSASHFVWARGIGSVGLTAKSYSVSTADRSVAITGNFGGRAGLGMDFDPGPGVYNLYCNPGSTSNSINIYALQLDTAGQFVCAGWMGGPTGIVTNSGFGIVVDGRGGMYLTGQFVSTADFDPDSTATYYLTTTNALDDEDIFVCKLNSPQVTSSRPVGFFFAADTLLCRNECVNFTNLSSSAVSYQWFFPGANMETDTSHTPAPVCYSQAGVYDVILVAANNFGSDTVRKEKYISVRPPDHVLILVSGDSVFCAGDSVQLCASASMLTYHWNTGDSSSCIWAKQAGAYWLTGQDQNDCPISPSRQNVGVHPVPSVSVSINGDTLISFSAVSYQWYLDDQPIQGAQTQIHIAQATGFYSVAVEDSNGCHAVSNRIYFLITGMENKNKVLHIYPNPSLDYFVLSVEHHLIGCNFRIYDSNGILMYFSKTNLSTQQIAINLPPGLYFLHFSSETEQIIKRLVRL